jgi:hypothetical protein
MRSNKNVETLALKHGENPSVTLKMASPVVDGMQIHCVERQEEMD